MPVASNRLVLKEDPITHSRRMDTTIFMKLFFHQICVFPDFRKVFLMKENLGLRGLFRRFSKKWLTV